MPMKNKPMKNKPKKGQYWICKYNGNNGDMPVGKVEIVRSNKKIFFVDLLNPTGKLRDKALDVLLDRNVQVTKRDAMKIVKVFKDTGNSLKAARDTAVEIAANYFDRKPKRKKNDVHVVQQLELPISAAPVASPAQTDVDEVLAVFCGFIDDEKMTFMMKAFTHLPLALQQQFSKQMLKSAISLLLQ